MLIDARRTFRVPAGGFSAVAVPVTNTLTETALATIAIPAGAMGPNGILRITSVFSFTNSANNKTLRFRLGGIGGTAFYDAVYTANQSILTTRIIQNRNSASSQVGGPSASINAFGANASAPATGTINTAVAQDLVITGQMAALAETITLESFLVELLYGA